MTVVGSFKIFAACVSFLPVYSQPTQPHMEGRIVGGGPVKISYYPHSVYLEASCDESEWHCGSSILNQKILLTAAHCVFGCQQDWSINAFAGHEVIKEMKLYRPVSSYVIHSKYEQASFIHDIALLHVSKSLNFGSNIKRAIIRRNFPGDRDLQIAGWGTVLENPQTRATRLKAVRQQLMSKRDCKQAYIDLVQGVRTDGMLCAKYNMKNRPSHGDSGSALITSDGTQVGLVSFRPQKTPEIIIYSNVTYYYQWIRNNAQRLACSRLYRSIQRRYFR